MRQTICYASQKKCFASLSKLLYNAIVPLSRQVHRLNTPFRIDNAELFVCQSLSQLFSQECVRGIKRHFI